MILPLMDIIVIPLLLGALVSVKNHAEWNFGPEYTFRLNKTTAVLMDIFVSESITATVKCRPNVLSQNLRNDLFCHAYKIIFSNITQQINKNINEKKTDGANSYKTVTVYNAQTEEEKRFFELNFGIQKVRGFKVKGEDLDPQLYGVISNIIEQFNMGINLSIEARNNMKNLKGKISPPLVMNSFIETNRGTMRASKCNTSLTITYTPSNHSYEDGEHWDKNKTKHNFRLRLLPISYTNLPDDTFSIERIRMACSNERQRIVFLNEAWNIEDMIKYQNIVKIRSTEPKFMSRSILEGYALLPRINHKIKHYFLEDVHLELLHIKPAQHELPEY